MMRFMCAMLAFFLVCSAVLAGDGNRLTYLDGGTDSYYVGRNFPKLVTPQWVGEEGVDAVVILAIDDMKDHRKYEEVLGPILERLKRIDGRAPVSIMTCRIDPGTPHLQQWLKEGVSLEVHTYEHPCPIMQDGDFSRAKWNVDKCVDLLASVPNNRPVAFRTPCCDSMDTPSPRLYAEILNKVTPGGNFLTCDSSVFDILTADDPELPRELVTDGDGREKFRKYVPFPAFVNTIENYPYPYVIGRLCWQWPCVTPSDWEAQSLQKPNNPKTVEDWKAALDAIAIKKGAFTMVFHPHGWIQNSQIVQLIDYAVAKHGKRVKFLNFREAQERIDKNLLGGVPLRAADGGDNGVRLMDLDGDGYLDVVIGNEKVRQTRVWRPKTKSWEVTDFPVAVAGAQFGIVHPDGRVSVIVHNESVVGAWTFEGGKWEEDGLLLTGLDVQKPIMTSRGGKDMGVRLRDLDGDGSCELIVGNAEQRGVYQWDERAKGWVKLPFALPAGTAIVDAEGKDAGLRFVDVDEDGHADVLFSNDERYSLSLFTTLNDGWGKQVMAGRRGEKPAREEIPKIVRGGTDNGVWFHSRHLWVRNEDTNKLPNLVDRRSFYDLLGNTEPGPRSAEAGLKSLHLAPGFTAELMAAEPLVEDPIAMAWGPDGKMWVVEMGDYPLGIDGKGRHGGRVKILEDTDGDGKYDKATVFLDKLGFPTGVTPWGKGVIVTMAPEIFYAEDTDGDGVADVRKTLFVGFVEGNQQHRVNGLWYGLDNWLYGANGHSGGMVTSMKTGQVVGIAGRDFRLRVDRGILEPEAGMTQYGRARDDWGDWFGCDNSNPCFQFVLPDRYTRRNAYVPVKDAKTQVPKIPGASPVFPVSRTVARFNDPGAANHFTSACSVMVYRDELLGKAYEGNMFVCEPVHNMVHREVMSRDGVAFTSDRAQGEEKSEFLASTDNWCRPVQVRTGPDGAVWVADMYRYVIEHPEWIPKDWQERLDLRAGHDRGRIYRIYPVGTKPRAIPRLDKLDAAGLAGALDSPSGWQRDLAQQMIVQGKMSDAAPVLKKMVGECQRPQGRLGALCALEGLGEIDEEVLGKALGDAHPGVRRNAVRIAEGWLGKSERVRGAVVKLAGDADPQVRMQVAFSLGEWDDPAAGGPLAEIALRDAGDRFITAAVMSSVNRQNLSAMVSAVMAGRGKEAVPPAQLLENLLRMASGMNDSRAVAELLGAVASPEGEGYAAWQFATMAGLLDALGQGNTSLGKLVPQKNAELKAVREHLVAMFDAARRIAADRAAPVEKRAMAVALLGRGLDRQAEDREALRGLLAPQVPRELEEAAIGTLGRLRGPEVPQVLLANWKTYGPSERAKVLDVLLSRSEWLTPLLDAAEKRKVLPSEFDAPRRQRLMQAAGRVRGARQRAEKLFADVVNPDREKVVEAFKAALSLKGEASRGAQTFTKVCATCHKLGGAGNEVGPDLASIGDKAPETLLISILDPNRAVEARYTNYVADTKDGSTYSGVLVGETGNSVTLLLAGGQSQTVLRSDLKSLRSTGLSLMPEGLEAGMQAQDVADLIAFIRSNAAPRKPKVLAGNKPEVVAPLPDGTLHLSAANAEVYGSTLTLESKYGNLGEWTKEDGEAAWTIDSPGGRFTVKLEYACDPKVAGNAFTLMIGEERITGDVASTGNWDTYRRIRLGDLTLPAGKLRVSLRSTGAISGALMDFSYIDLSPAKK